MREVLADSTIYSYLAPRAVNRLERARRLARESGLLSQTIIPAGGDSCFILPWMGTKSFRTLERLLKVKLAEPLKLRSVVPMEPYYMVVSGRTDADTLLAQVLMESSSLTDLSELLKPDEAPYLGKYDEFVDPNLLRIAFSEDGLERFSLL